ncbi:hypothetical protein [Propionibacterium australiense]|uniref:Uncharacterized protein n=1 Tax=Propionibacterium australiense TaxID=119981 RepID=A0A8B3FNP6_9ACTN|nr:hypothetical protein [Propionibacterium australiense]RLP12233.1 hypothetical protein D7U36_02955 [Propionibacterium australiense]
MTAQWKPDRPEWVGVGYGLLVGVLIGALICAGIASMAGYERPYLVAWGALVVLSGLCLCCAHHRRWLGRGWPVALLLAAVVLALTGHAAAIFCGATGVAALTAGCVAIRGWRQ